MSMNATDPSVLFGGTWERIKDRFVLAAGDNYASGATGGEVAHTLTVDEMPRHNHALDNLSYSSSPSSIDNNENGVGFKRNATYPIYASTYAGGGAAHNNMPPYLVAYMWYRVA